MTCKGSSGEHRALAFFLHNAQLPSMLLLFLPSSPLFSQTNLESVSAHLDFPRTILKNLHWFLKRIFMLWVRIYVLSFLHAEGNFSTRHKLSSTSFTVKVAAT